MKVYSLRLVVGNHALKGSDYVQDNPKLGISIERINWGDFVVLGFGRPKLIPREQVKFADLEETPEPEIKKVPVSDLKK